MASRDAGAAMQVSAQAQPSDGRPKVLICKAGPAEVVDACLMQLSVEAEVEQVATLADAMRRCLQGSVDILFVNLFSFTARELTALSAFRSMVPDLAVVAVAGGEMRSTHIGRDLADEVYIFSSRPQRAIQPRA